MNETNRDKIISKVIDYIPFIVVVLICLLAVLNVFFQPMATVTCWDSNGKILVSDTGVRLTSVDAGQFIYFKDQVQHVVSGNCQVVKDSKIKHAV